MASKKQKEIERLRRIIGRMVNENPDVSVDDVISAFADETRSTTLFNFMPNMVTRRKQLGKVKTAEGYQCALNSFRRFRGGADVMLTEITSLLMQDYQAWLQSRGIALNTVSFYMRKLRATYNQAVAEGLIADKRPFKNVFTGTEKTRKRALTAAEVSKIKTVNLSANGPMRLARDMFMLSFYMRGMSFVDMAYLRKANLNGGVVTYRRRKTNQLIRVKWTIEMQRIINAYRSTGEYLLPLIANGSTDERRAYINMCHKINYHLKKLGKRLGVNQPLTMYCSRHSWATIARNRGIAMSVISEGLGHDSERTTRIYLASMDNGIIDRANQQIISAV
jgi:integrase